jgi:hypothetical protein
MCHYNRPYKRATLGEYSFADIYLKTAWFLLCYWPFLGFWWELKHFWSSEYDWSLSRKVSIRLIQVLI